MEANFKKIILEKYNSSPRGWYKWLTSKKNSILLDALNQEFPQLQDITEKVYWLANNLTDYPICPTCGKSITEFGRHRSNIGSKFCYNKYCCSACAANNSETLSLRQKTCLEKYGDATYNNPEKTTLTCKKLYGTGRNNEQAKKTMLLKYGTESYLSSEQINNLRNSQEIQDKIQTTKRKNKTFNTSSAEEKYYNYLLTKYSVDDIIRQYKDERYPFNCDFYIKSEDLFIELNLNWTHGKHPFNATVEEDILKASILKEKAKESKFYKNAYETWTIRDPKKLSYAKLNNLNYLMVYQTGDFYEKDNIRQDENLSSKPCI